MKRAAFAEQEAAKTEIVGGIKCKKKKQFPTQREMLSKQYYAVENGTFHEVTDPKTGTVKFRSDKHSGSRIYGAP